MVVNSNHLLIHMSSWINEIVIVLSLFFPALSCGFPYNINNVEWMANDNTGEYTATLTCGSGYYQTTILNSCSATGNWIAVNSTCISCKFN
jgi:hypothetical protein